LAVTLQHSLQHSLVIGNILTARWRLLLLLLLFQLHEVTLREVPHKGSLSKQQQWQQQQKQQKHGGMSDALIPKAV
jgi:hypothetical protein